MKADLAKWHEKEGIDFLGKIGVKKGYTVIDFGCGKGNYTLPASRLVGKIGMVYAPDKNASTLSKLEKIITEENIKNVELIGNIKNSSLKDNSVDVVLCYDVLHHINSSDRKIIYNDFRRVLRKEALFSVYPKHCIGNSPSREFADVDIETVIKEIEDSGFVLTEKTRCKLLHSGSFEKGVVLNFRKGDLECLG
jgi:ubiquinone/menaquinone biosynthesis C-methylase UbiE